MLKFSFFSLCLARLSSTTLSTLFTSASGVSKTLILLFLSSILVSCGSGDGTGTGGANPEDPEAEILRIGNGSGSNFTQGALSASQTALDAGESATILVNIVNQAGDPPTDATVSFSSVCVSSALASVSAPISITPGLISIVYTAEGCSGDDIVTATLIETGATATVTLSVLPPEVLTVSYISSSLPQLSLAGIGGNESTELIFEVSGPQGVSIIGANVTFTINSTAGGASILTGRETGVTDNDGQVRTIVSSGTVAGPISVLAVHDATGIQGLSDDIIISTGVPVSSRFSLSFSEFNPPDAFNTDGIEVTLSIISSDQFGNNSPDGTQISFVAPESGNVESSCQLNGGACSVIWRSSTPRPNDGRLELIAYTDGAEDFIDNNGNSVFDGSDGAIIDLGEPYADQNENGIYDIGEYFFDANGNEVRNTGNGLWDGPCLAQVNSAAICTGEPSTTISATGTIVLSSNSPAFSALGSFPAAFSTITIQQSSSVSFSQMVLSDDTPGNINPLPVGTTMVFTIEGEGAAIQGNGSYTTSNSTFPLDGLGVTVLANEFVLPDPLPSSVLLLLTVTTPDTTTTQYTWPLNITY